MSETVRKSAWVYVAAAVALGACLWIGWGDFDPYVPRATVQAAIRATPRGLLQLIVQWLAPIGLLLFLGRGLLAQRRPRQG
jgi:hypothetical protein